MTKRQIINAMEQLPIADEADVLIGIDGDELWYTLHKAEILLLDDADRTPCLTLSLSPGEED